MPSLSPTMKRDLQTLLYAYGIVGSVRSVLALSKRLRRRRKQHQTSASQFDATSSASGPWTDSLTLSLAAYPVAFQRSFAVAQSWYPDSVGVPAFLASPSILFIPAAWRSQLVLYACASALVSAPRPPNVDRFLPPIWILNCLGNAVLVYLFVTEKDGVDQAYEGIVLRHSGGYVPRGKTKADIVELVTTTDYPRITREQARALNPPAHPLHSRYVCAVLHPDTPSCLENYLSSIIHECSKIWKWMGVFGLAAVLFKRRGATFTHPWSSFRQWLSYTARSTLFASGSISTAWALNICFWQRVLPATSQRRLRLMLGGLIASLWILVLPSNRRKDISLYVARMAVLNAYQTFKAKTGYSIPYGELPLFALALTSLIKTSREGKRVNGLAAVFVKQLGQ